MILEDEAELRNFFSLGQCGGSEQLLLFDGQVLDLLGPKTEADMAKPEKKSKQPKQAAQGGGDQNNKKKPVENGNKEEEDEGAASIVELMKKVSFHKPGENYKTDG